MAKTKLKPLKIEEKAFDKMCKTIREYLRLRGWNLYVIGEPKILKEVGSLKYNYVFEVGFTGKKNA